MSDLIHTAYLPECQDLIGRNKNDTWNLSDCNGIRTHKHLVLKETLYHLAKLTKWLSWIVSKYLYGASDCMSLSCDYAYQNESTLCICLDLKKLLVQTWAISEK